MLSGVWDANARDSQTERRQELICNQSAISPDSEGGWRCVSSAVVRSQGWNAAGTGGPLVLHHWGCAAPGCLWGWRTGSSSTAVSWVSLQLEVGWKNWRIQTTDQLDYIYIWVYTQKIPFNSSVPVPNDHIERAEWANEVNVKCWEVQGRAGKTSARTIQYVSQQSSGTTYCNTVSKIFFNLISGNLSCYIEHTNISALYLSQSL